MPRRRRRPTHPLQLAMDAALSRMRRGGVTYSPVDLYARTYVPLSQQGSLQQEAWNALMYQHRKRFESRHGLHVIDRARNERVAFEDFATPADMRVSEEISAELAAANANVAAAKHAARQLWEAELQSDPRVTLKELRQQVEAAYSVHGLPSPYEE